MKSTNTSFRNAFPFVIGVLFFSLVFASCSGGDKKEKLLSLTSDSSSLTALYKGEETLNFFGASYDAEKGTITFSEDMMECAKNLNFERSLTAIENKFDLKGVDVSYFLLNINGDLTRYDYDLCIVAALDDKDAFDKSMNNTDADKVVSGDYTVYEIERDLAVVVYDDLIWITDKGDNEKAVEVVENICKNAKNHPLKDWKRKYLESDESFNLIADNFIPALGTSVKFLGVKAKAQANEVTASFDLLDKDGNLSEASGIEMGKLAKSNFTALAGETQIMAAVALGKDIFNPAGIIGSTIRRKLFYELGSQQLADEISSILAGIRSISFGLGRDAQKADFDVSLDTWIASVAVEFETPQESASASASILNFVKGIESTAKIDPSGSLGNFNVEVKDSCDFTVSIRKRGSDDGETLKVNVKSENNNLSIACNNNPFNGHKASFECEGDAMFIGADLPVNSPMGRMLMLDNDFYFSLKIMPSHGEFNAKFSATEGTFVENLLLWFNKVENNSYKYTDH